MKYIFGVVFVFGCVLGGYRLHNDDMSILWQPAEVLIIVGAVVGGTIIGFRGDKIKALISLSSELFKSKPKDKVHYLELLSFSFNAFRLMKIKGMLAMEAHIENPKDSELFKMYPTLLQDEFALNFIVDYLRVLTMGVDDPNIVEPLMDADIEEYADKQKIAGKIYGKWADSFPAIGIVAAVLGVITSMGSISEPPEILGAKIAAALVGTFLGVFLSYGIVGPMSINLNIYADEKVKFMNCIKSGFISHLQGNAPIITAEFIRRVIPMHARPDFKESDEYINSNSKNF